MSKFSSPVKSALTVHASTSLPNFSLNYSSVCVHFFLQKDNKDTKYQIAKLIYGWMEDQGNPCMPEGGLMSTPSNGSGRGRRLRQPQPCEYCGLRGRALCSRCKVKPDIIILATSLDFRSGNSYPAKFRGSGTRL